MGLETQTDVEEIRNVQNQAGDVDAPANETQQRRQTDALENNDGLTALEYQTSSTTVEQLPSHSVPEGVTVLVTYLSGNGSDVWVGNADAQPICMTGTGDAVGFDVTDTSAIHVRANTSGDGVGILFEGGGA
ncbi:hypothetical protein [Halomicrobium urmianum]|uniref:hypothetical protein n=1 Tax=Halomicrobium urmianum TaxID=1586233 RepID=UPI001CD9AF48|nr:hypothetical protein [Halomicrobium urmianum]